MSSSSPATAPAATNSSTNPSSQDGMQLGTLQLDGEQELWFTYRGTGALDLRGFKL